MLYLIGSVVVLCLVAGVSWLALRSAPQEPLAAGASEQGANEPSASTPPAERLNRVTLRFAVELSRVDEHDAVQEQISDASVLASFDGTQLLDHDDDPGADPVFDVYPEIVTAALGLAHSARGLQAELTLTLSEEPKATHLERYRSELCGEYWERAWAADLEWDEPESRPSSFEPTDRWGIEVKSALVELDVA